MKTTFIYVLRDPRTAEVRYVGKSDAPSRRLKRHLQDSRTLETHTARWIRQLSEQGFAPKMEVIQEVPFLEWGSWEAAWIEFYRESGAKITNLTLGGDTGPDVTGKIITEETRALMSRRALERFSDSRNHPCFGKPKSREARLKMSEAALKRFSDPKKHPCYGKPKTPETRKKIGEANTNPSTETRHKQSASQKARWGSGAV